MKTEFERISEIMYTLLEHQPVIDVPYEKINDIAVALVKEGYGKVSEYETEIESLKAERKMLGSKIKVLEQRLNNKYIEVDNLNRDYRNAFERLKAQEREIDKLKAKNEQLEEDVDMLIKEQKYDHECEIVQAKIDVLTELKERLDNAPNGWAYTGYIDDIIEELDK